MKEEIKPMLIIALCISFGIIIMFSLFMFFDEILNHTRYRNAKYKLKTTMVLSEIRIEKAKGIAAANKIISESLKNNDNYLSYLFIDSLKHTKDKVIYIPTEHGIPVIESNRALK